MAKYKSIITLLFIMFASPVFSRAASFVPPDQKTLLIVGQDKDTIANYVHATHHAPGGAMFYTSIQKMDGLGAPIDYGAGTMDGDILLRAYPNSVIQLGLYMVGGLANTSSGTYDLNLRKLAKWIKRANRPVYLRIGYEFDLPLNQYDPQEYKEAFQYVVDFLRQEGVKNVAIVWHTQCSDQSQEKWMDWYPGDKYVDWFGVSLFTTHQIPMALNFHKLAKAHGKPFMICESTPWAIYTIRGEIDWFNHIFQFIKDANVSIFCYINSNWDKQSMWASWKIGDARIEKDVVIKKLWLDETTQERYLQASPHLSQLLGWNKSK